MQGDCQGYSISCLISASHFQLILPSSEMQAFCTTLPGSLEVTSQCLKWEARMEEKKKRRKTEKKERIKEKDGKTLSVVALSEKSGQFVYSC